MPNRKYSAVAGIAVAMVTHGHHCGTGANKPNANTAIAVAVTGILVRAVSRSHRESPNRVAVIADNCINEAPGL
ncbi:MAG: hypothetical protein ACC683_01645 [Acidimicrobiia bacterium]